MTDTTRSCISCKKPITVDEWYIHDGVEFVGSPGYGSTFDSVLQEKSVGWPESSSVMKDGERIQGDRRRLSIVICDHCLANEAEEFITVTHSVTVGRQVTSSTPWSESDHPKRWRDHQAKKNTPA